MPSESTRPSKGRDACSKCGTPVDPLRAARVRLIGTRFFYFCSQSCAEAFSEEDLRSSPPPTAPREVASSPPPGRAAAPPEAEAEPKTRPSKSLPPPAPEETHAVPTRAVPTHAVPTREEAAAAATRRDAPAARQPGASKKGPSDAFLLRTALIASLSSLTLLLALESVWTLVVRLCLTLLGVALLLVAAVRASRGPRAPRWFEVVAAPLGASVITCVLLGLNDDAAAQGVSLAGASLLAAVLCALLLRRRGRAVEERIQAIRQGLSHATSRLQGGQLLPVEADQLGAGEDIVIHAGETVPADVTVTSGRAEVNPWLGATVVRPVEPGDTLYAGARLSSGQLRATVRWTGHDRHWLRLLSDPLRRVDTHAPLALLGRKAAHQGALLGALAAVGVGLVVGSESSLIALWAVALAGAFYNPAHGLGALRALLTVLDLLDRGVVAKSAQVVDVAGRISTAVFCARGTLLMGEPELSHLESFGNLRNEEVLSLVVGAEQYGRHPVAVAVSRAARARGIRPDAVRTPVTLPGLGVTAVTSDGKPLAVGSRSLMLKERISIARVEDRIAEIEASGRTVLLVAVAQKLVGLVALQDGLRPGARAAVQHLLDAGIEPVLLSGDARQTCEALGKSIDIEHIRPEVLPNERGTEIERLKSGGATVAVVGRSPSDDVALSAASVSIALPSPGSRSTEFDVELASDEVQTAAVALFQAHRGRRQALKGLALLLAGAVVSSLLVLAASMPPALVPFLGIVALLLADVTSFAPPKT